MKVYIMWLYEKTIDERYYLVVVLFGVILGFDFTFRQMIGLGPLASLISHHFIMCHYARPAFMWHAHTRLSD